MLKAIKDQSERLQTAQKTHGDFHINVSEDLKQLALLFIMNSEFDRALPLLHQRLVIHEKFGPEDLTAEALQDLGTVYRLGGMLDIAMQHLMRALTLREKCHGKSSLKVAETFNSVALVKQMNDEIEQAETYQLRSLEILYNSTESENCESEEIPQEIDKQLEQQRESADSIIQVKSERSESVVNNVLEVLTVTEKVKNLTEDDIVELNEQTATGLEENAISSEDLSLDGNRRRDSQPRVINDACDLVGSSCNAILPVTSSTSSIYDLQNADFDSVPLEDSMIAVQDIQLLQDCHNTPVDSAETSHAINAKNSLISQTICDFPALQQRVDFVKHLISTKHPTVDAEVTRLTEDVDCIQAQELREIGISMVALLLEMSRLSRHTDITQQEMPVLEGTLERNCASIFRGWVKRWFKVDPKTFVLSYYFKKEDYTRGFSPCGSFAVSRISHIHVPRHTRGKHYHFDVVVDVSTRLNPKESRTYELRSESEGVMRHWVETLQYYKAMALKSSAG